MGAKIIIILQPFNNTKSPIVNHNFHITIILQSTSPYNFTLMVKGNMQNI
jgi:hypothetical protein